MIDPGYSTNAVDEVAEMFLDNITVRCGRFKGVEKEEFLDMKDFNGNLFDNLENIIIFIKEHLNLKAEIKGMRRIESWELPIEVLRESVINALIHRDYAKPGYIYVKIYDANVDAKPETRQRWILIYLEENEKIKSKSIQKRYGISKEIASRDLKSLIKQNKIVKKGAGNNVWYELKEDEKNVK